jgi:hypothetical protein
VQTAMILLRHCGVPKMSYLLRVTPPAAMKDVAAQFDHEILRITHELLGLTGTEHAWNVDVNQQLQAPLRYGGFGITSATATSHPAYLASVASALPASALHVYTEPDNPLPEHSMLHTQLTDCIQTISETTPACADLLPDSASEFFSYYEHRSSASVAQLQSSLNKQATQHLFDAAVNRAESAEDTHTVARLNAITAPHAPDWKATAPSNPQTTLSDTHYRIAAQMNLGIPLSSLPPDCYGCKHGKGKVKDDPYHYLSCPYHKRRQITLGHNMLLQILYLYINYVGGTAIKEPKHLHDKDDRTPDLELMIDDQHILTDVHITHPLCPTHVRKSARSQMKAAERGEYRKTHKYTHTAQLHDAAFIPFVMEATGGMSESAREIYEKIVLASRNNRTLWPHEIIARDLRGAIAITVQKRNSMTMIAGRCLAIGRAATSAAA